MLTLIAPEICITIMACLVLLSDFFVKKYAGFFNYILSLFALAVAAGLTIAITPDTTQRIFNDSFIVDRFACQLKMVMYVLLASIFIYSRVYGKKRNLLLSEFFSLTLFSLLGMMILISCANFLSLYLGLELLVLPIYAMIVLVKNQSKYIEAAMKYFIIGSLGAGLLLYGISLIYGATGSISFEQISVISETSALFKLGMLFVITGIALEFGAVPFHMWLPDVYEGSPTTVTMIVSTVPKIAVFALSYRLLTLAFPAITHEWQQLFLIMALASVALGNIMAIAQSNLKRMLAYSTISHVGFILLGLFVAPQEGYTAVIFYTIVYAFMALAAFAMIMRLSSAGFEADQIADLRGLNKTSPWLAFIMLLIMLSLSGVPPLIGFYAKFLILQAIVNAGFAWVAIIALLTTVIGAFYYLKVACVMYFEEPNFMPVMCPDMSRLGKVLLSAHGILLLVLGVLPAPVLYFCLDVFR